METKIKKIGNDVAIVIPKELVDKLHLNIGDKLNIEKRGDGLMLKHMDSEFEEWAEVYRQANSEYKKVLKEL
ncbi:AbrB/MazE/SpoVT family DNA-binding domain-containing protein [Fodinibius saliphilus]|uniref:AbrB/MazE/SpoVT family DNA-binding domain-containing protein n=1 Tax=Fodinibius saliphilus TaxID=1920650 RepID=UPI0011096E4B|nr:AbrB/MazE/SpoVT family DNA-binding domain-containing protein [Fodinibius saliphilus]